MPVPSAVISVPISWLPSILSKRARSTLRILPRSGSTAWNSRLRPCLAEPPARVALDDEQFGLGRIALLAVGELAGQRIDVERALAPRQLARLARGLAGGGGLDHLADDGLGFRRMLLEPGGERSLMTPSTAGRTSEETSLSLVCDENFGSATLIDSTAVRPSRQSSPVRVDLFLARAAARSRHSR